VFDPRADRDHAAACLPRTSAPSGGSAARLWLYTASELLPSPGLRGDTDRRLATRNSDFRARVAPTMGHQSRSTPYTTESSGNNHAESSIFAVTEDLTISRRQRPLPGAVTTTVVAARAWARLAAIRSFMHFVEYRLPSAIEQFGAYSRSCEAGHGSHLHGAEPADQDRHGYHRAQGRAPRGSV
jgi:hypothetical protein